jgi:hypothetical protein
MVSFASDLVFLIWPTQMLAVMEATSGPVVAATLALTTNVVLFGLLGLAVAMFASCARGYAFAYGLVTALIVLLAFWGAGFSTAHLNAAALLVALLIYATPFYIAWRVAR